MSYNKNQDTRHHYQAGDKRRHPSIDESPDFFDQITVTAGHDFDTTVDDKNDLSLFSKEKEKFIHLKMESSMNLDTMIFYQ